MEDPRFNAVLMAYLGNQDAPTCGDTVRAILAAVDRADREAGYSRVLVDDQPVAWLYSPTENAPSSYVEGVALTEKLRDAYRGCTAMQQGHYIEIPLYAAPQEAELVDPEEDEWTEEAPEEEDTLARVGQAAAQYHMAILDMWLEAFLGD